MPMLLPGRLCPPVAAAGYRRERTLDVCRKRYIERSGQPELPCVETHGWDLNPGPLSHQEVTTSCDASVLSRRDDILPRGSRMLQRCVGVPHAGPARKEKETGPVSASLPRGAGAGGARCVSRYDQQHEQLGGSLKRPLRPPREAARIACAYDAPPPVGDLRKWMRGEGRCLATAHGRRTVT